MQTKSDKKYILKAARAAFPYTIPIFAGFWFLGITYGIYMNVSGFSFIYPAIMSLTIFGGSLQFVAVEMLLSAYAPLQTLIMTLMIQARHIFYGISMLDKYKNMGWKKFYLIFGLCDESFSIIYSVDVGEDIDKGWFMFFVTLFNHFYWFSGATLGGILGSLVSFNTKGLEFVMTAMFVVIFLEQWLKEKKHYSSLIGIMVSVVCLYLFGAESFIVPTMVGILFLLTVFRKPIEKVGGLE
ncbi:MAG: AzlC family ABC transporter permease [bacterium]|nr:AzlC family ABC transporter permease [bacterium]